MNAKASAAEASQRRDATRPRLLGALLRREFRVTLALLLVLTAVSAAAAAYEVYGADGGGGFLTGRLLRRFDYALLGVLVVFLVFRTAVTIEVDHASGWLAPFFAAGGSRISYGVVAAATALTAPLTLFAVSAVAFAVSVARFSGSAELIHLLPRTIGGGFLVLGCFSVLTVGAGILLRRASAVAFAVGLLATGPLFLGLRYAAADEMPPSWMFHLQLMGPPVIAPPDLANTVRGMVYLLVTGALAAFISHRHAGRIS